VPPTLISTLATFAETGAVIVRESSVRVRDDPKRIGARRLAKITR
jgi:hypothetical protein